MLLKPKDYIRELADWLEKSRHPENSGPMKAYVRDKFEFFGLKGPERRELFKIFFNRQGLPEPADLEETVYSLFELPEREFQYFAIELAGKFKRQWKPESIGLFEEMAVRKSWWDSVDYINNECLSDYFRRFPDDRYKITKRWIDSRNIWLQRLSVIFQLRYRKDTDVRLLKRNILRLTASNEFFVQKAIGWALRQYARTDPELVMRFVSENELKPLSRREALKHLSSG